MNHAMQILDGAAGIIIAGGIAWLLKFMRSVDRRLTRIETKLHLHDND